MRQLYEKFPYERLKTLHWEKADSLDGGYSYFFGTGEAFKKHFPEQHSVMGFSDKKRLKNRSGGMSDCFLIEQEGSETQLNKIRNSTGLIVTEAESLGADDVNLFWDIQSAKDDSKTVVLMLQTMAEALELICYSVVEKSGMKEITFNLKLPSGITNILSAAEVGAALEEGIRRGQAQNYARYLGDLPANALTPQILAGHAEDRLSNVGQVTIVSEKELVTLGFGGILAVAQGSKNRPRLVVFDNEVQNPSKTIVLIGKGITFDTGGYSIKGKQHHNEMKYDMCGAANTIAALEILAPQYKNVRLIGLLPLAENMVSADAQRPGDVYVAHNGKKIEVYNTDAEGRLILADVLSYAGQFKPDLVIDIATLTGGTTSIAGNLAGVFCTNDDSVLPLVRGASRIAGEKFVHLEIIEEAVDDLRSDVADYTNMHNKWSTGAPTMYAAAFLKEFIPADCLWIHFDIANMAWSGRSSPYMRGRGATAYGTRTLANLVKSFCG